MNHPRKNNRPRRKKIVLTTDSSPSERAHPRSECAHPLYKLPPTLLPCTTKATQHWARAQRACTTKLLHYLNASKQLYVVPPQCTHLRKHHFLDYHSGGRCATAPVKPNPAREPGTTAMCSFHIAEIAKVAPKVRGAAWPVRLNAVDSA